MTKTSIHRQQIMGPLLQSLLLVCLTLLPYILRYPMLALRLIGNQVLSVKQQPQF